MRQPKPYFKKAKKAWYANLGPNRRPVKLAEGEDNEKAAWEKYHILMAGRQPLENDPLIQDVFQRFLDHHVASAKRTYDFYSLPAVSFLAYLKEHAKRVRRTSELKPIHVADWVESCRLCRRSRRIKGKKGHRGGQYKTETTDRPVSQNTHRNRIRAIKAAFRWAEQMGVIDKNPIKWMKVPAAIPRGDEAYLMPEEWSRLVGAIKDGPFLDFLTVLKESGCRPREAATVEARWFKRNDRCWVFPKSDSEGKMENRVVPLTDRAFEICQSYALKHPEGPMFRTRLGTPWRRQALDSRCARLREKLKIHVTPYSVRHTFATDAIIRGVDLQTIAVIMGHKDLRMLSRIYQHVQKRSDHIREGLRRATGA